jgi:16S rRNA (cytosine1402-N4)-methyltransferase
MKNKSLNKHIPVMLNQIKDFIPFDRKINVIDATFGGGGYSLSILESFRVNKLIAIDRDPISQIFSQELKEKYPDKFNLVNGCFSDIDQLVKNAQSDEEKKIKFDIIIFDLGISSNQLEDPKRGFSFKKDGPLEMNMGHAKLLASDILNTYPQKEIASILFKYGEEKYAKKIAKKIVEYRDIKIIRNTSELVKIIKQSIPYSQTKKIKINPATRTFQALRIYVNDELNELKKALNKSEYLLLPQGRLLVVSFQSLEDKIVKDYFNHKSGKKRRSSRHYPELAEEGPITFKLITKKPLRPEISEINSNPRSRSAKLRVAEKIIQQGSS